MNDRRTVLLVVGILGAIAVVLSAGLIYLTAIHVDPGNVISGLAGTAIGSLASLLASTRSNPPA